MVFPSNRNRPRSPPLRFWSSPVRSKKFERSQTPKWLRDMGFMPNKIERKDLEPGDHIYVFRPGYTHHGIYKGDEGDKVIHLTRGESRNTLNKSPFHPSKGLVVRCTLDEFLSGGELYRFEYGVNPLSFLTKLWGTCTCACSDPVEDVLDRATSLLTDESQCKTDCFGDYDLTNNNCEDFALYCKTGLLDVKGSRRTGSSGQVALFVAVITTVYAYIFMPYGFLPTSVTGIALMFCFLICNSRLHFDAGSRNTYLLRKVSVEEFKQLSSPDVEWMELGTKWILMLAALAFIAWYWTPKSMILLCVRSFLLYVLLSLLVIGYLRNHRFKLYVYVANNLMALLLWHWTPESNDFQGIRRLWLLAVIDKLVIKPMINPSSKPLQFIMEVIYLSAFWYWTPESTILQWVRLFFLTTTILWAVNKTRNHCSKPLIYILDCISVLVVWYWTPEPEGINFQWIRLFLLNVSLCQLVADLRNHRLLSSVCIVNFILALVLWNWSPERTIFLWIRSLLICGLPILFVIDPYFPFKLANLDAPWLLGLWWWTPESTIVSWIRFLFLSVLLLRLVGRIYLFLVLINMG